MSSALRPRWKPLGSLSLSGTSTLEGGGGGGGEGGRGGGGEGGTGDMEQFHTTLLPVCMCHIVTGCTVVHDANRHQKSEK